MAQISSRAKITHPLRRDFVIRSLSGGFIRIYTGTWGVASELKPTQRSYLNDRRLQRRPHDPRQQIPWRRLVNFPSSAKTCGSWGFYALFDRVLVPFVNPGSNREFGVFGTVTVAPATS